ncbi:hypothetical protein [Salinibacter ruber]|uniref:hypothetical protein n=1 Tax=Salinibacter ruber TaxID=146919 RepID=UPI00216836F0|nr:hypothetical protein [Salinibacter ruber]MCS3756990.1 dipeptidyl aminopeptidase/acylaminoacyl peptidase [Salinibacter ruber]MCS3955860.1 dipeptidyl aminopeptidase/acylaminoacyl peptidase [Salinibacter ruber]
MTTRYCRGLLFGLMLFGVTGCFLSGPPEFDEVLGTRLATLPGHSSFDRLVAGSGPVLVYVGAAGIHRIDPTSGGAEVLVPAGRLPRSSLLGDQVVTSAAQMVSGPEGGSRLIILFDERTEGFRRRAGGVYVVNTRQDGVLRPLLDGVSAVRVSPGGRRITYVRAGPEPGQDSLFVAPFDNGRVNTDQARHVAKGLPVVFSPDGSALVVDAGTFGTTLRRVVLPDDLSQASVEPLPSAPVSTDLRLRLQGQWSEEVGLRVAFRDTGRAETLRVWRADAETTRSVWTPPSSEQSSTTDLPRWAPRLAPDGSRRLAVWTRRCYEGGGFPCTRSRYTLWRVNPPTGEATPVARTGGGGAEEAAFTPTGSRLALLVRREGDTAVHLSAER